MSLFARVDNGTVTDVLVVPDGEDGNEYLNSLGFAGVWVETWQNMWGGDLWEGEEPVPMPGRRYTTGSVGFTYDDERDAFIPPKPDGDWVLDDDTCLWTEV
jgi:hypothetical protein